MYVAQRAEVFIGNGVRLIHPLLSFTIPLIFTFSRPHLGVILVTVLQPHFKRRHAPEIRRTSSHSDTILVNGHSDLALCILFGKLKENRVLYLGCR